MKNRSGQFTRIFPAALHDLLFPSDESGAEPQLVPLDGSCLRVLLKLLCKLDWESGNGNGVWFTAKILAREIPAARKRSGGAGQVSGMTPQQFSRAIERLEKANLLVRGARQILRNGLEVRGVYLNPAVIFLGSDSERAVAIEAYTKRRGDMGFPVGIGDA